MEPARLILLRDGPVPLRPSATRPFCDGSRARTGWTEEA